MGNREDAKSMVMFNISILKEMMKEKDLMFTFIIDKNDPNKSHLGFVDKYDVMAAQAKGDLNSIKDKVVAISLDELNKGLV